MRLSVVSMKAADVKDVAVHEVHEGELLYGLIAGPFLPSNRLATFPLISGH